MSGFFIISALIHVLLAMHYLIRCVNVLGYNICQQMSWTRGTVQTSANSNIPFNFNRLFKASQKHQAAQAALQLASQRQSSPAPTGQLTCPCPPRRSFRRRKPLPAVTYRGLPVDFSSSWSTSARRVTVHVTMQNLGLYRRWVAWAA